MPFAETATGARLHYEDIGTGEPIILIHGFLGTARKELLPLMNWLSVAYRAIGPTLRGYGESQPKPRRFPRDFYQRDAADVLAFMDALGLERAHIFGYSDGGEVALLAAGNAPARFMSVVVWGAVGYFGPAMRASTQSVYPAAWMTAEDRALHGIDNPDRFALEWVQACKHIIDSGGDLSLSLAPNITCPLLMMLGESDRFNPAEYARRFVEQAPAARLEMLPCGHAIHDEDWAGFRQAVAEFLPGLAA